ncbi:MAG: FtsW/RodA/SpoVE family cell cycle protein [bacterium]|nr:FtsW/RodA/SpoVE family cell cycle protein [bacterium]
MKISWPLLLPAFILSVCGLLILGSIGQNFFLLQGLWILIGGGLLVFFSFFNWRSLMNYQWFAYGIYVTGVLLLLFTYFLAPTIRGVKAWIVLGPFLIQTSEFVKASLIFVFAYFFGKYHVSIGQVRTIFFSFILVIIPMGLILIQPDLGSAIVLGGLWFSLLMLSGLRLRHLLGFMAIFIVIGFLGWNYFLAPYQKERIVGLFNPAHDPLGVNYNIIQSKIAIGSAGFLGKGYKQGTQTQLGFLPQANADFILAAFIEEWGIAGGLIIMAAFLYLVFTILKIGTIAETNFEKFICLGTATVFSLHFVINTGSTLGLFPVVGIPFPFLSYGGSNLITNFFLLGVVHSIYQRRL